MEKNSSAMKNYRRYSGPVLIRSELLEAKFGYKTSNFASSSSSLKAVKAAKKKTCMCSIDRSAVKAAKKKTCMCSPTTHPGSFRCSVHKRVDSNGNGDGVGVGRERSSASPYRSNRLSARRSAMTNSLVRIGMVEGDLMKRALAALIRPSSNQQRRRTGFQPRPTRLCVMSAAGDS